MAEPVKQQEAQRLGGVGPVHEGNAEAQGVADKVRGVLEEQTKKHFSEFTALQYRTQVVNGINYFIKVKVAETEFIHLRVYQKMDQSCELSGYQLGKSLEDTLDYFGMSK